MTAVSAMLAAVPLWADDDTVNEAPSPAAEDATAQPNDGEPAVPDETPEAATTDAAESDSDEPRGAFGEAPASGRLRFDESTAFEFTEELAPIGRARTAPGEDQEAPPSFEPWRMLLHMGAMLGLLIGLLLAVIWLARRSPKMKRYFGGGPIQILGRSYLAPRYAVFTVKVGDRILVVGQGPDGLRTLSEIREPDEVTRLVAEVAESRPDSSTATFKQALKDTLKRYEKGGGPRGGSSAGGRRESTVGGRPNVARTGDMAESRANSGDGQGAAEPQHPKLRELARQMRAGDSARTSST